MYNKTTNSNVELKFTPQTLTDERLNYWLQQFQQTMYSCYIESSLQKLINAYFIAKIIYSHYFRLLLSEENIQRFDEIFKMLYNKINLLKYQKNKDIIIDIDLLRLLDDLVSDLERLVQTSNYFFNVRLNLNNLDVILATYKMRLEK